MKPYTQRNLRLCGILLVLSVLFALNASVTTQAAEPITSAKKITAASDFTFDAATGMITGYTGTDTCVVIPHKINDVAVVGISGTFNGNATLQTVILPNTLTTIGDYTFNSCTQLNNIAYYDVATELPSDTTCEDVNSYVYCEELSVGYNAYNIGWGKATITDGILTIGKQAFGGKTGISSFIVTEGNTTYSTTEDGVCLLSKVMLNDVFVGTNVVRFASGYTCNSGYTLPEGLYSVGSYAFEDIHNDGPLTFPSSIQVISDYGFFEYGMIDNNFIFPEDCALHTIGSYGFTYNRKLQINFPKNLKTIGSYFCSYNQNVAIDISETQIETIPEYAFADCSALHQLKMPATLKHIEAYAFTNCNNLSTVEFLGTELLTLGTGAFKDSPTLHYITIPEGVTNIENDTFSGCGNLDEVVLPDSVTTIGDNAFKGCVTIHTLVIPPNVNYISNSSFDGVDQTKIDTSKNSYAQTLIKGTDTVTKSFPKQETMVTIGKLKYKITLSNGTIGTVSVIGAKNKKQKTITIPSTVKIDGYTFKVTSIAAKAFSKNKKLTKVTIGSNVTTIGKQAFYNCKKLKKITVKSKKIKSVKSKAFKGINKKAKIKLPKMSKKKFKKYKKKFAKKGQAKTVKITK